MLIAIPFLSVGQISTFPHTEDFESLPYTYFNTSAFGDDFDWSLNSGATVSSGTGPSADHTTGSPTGYYIYTESSSPNNNDKKADIISTTYDFSSLTTANLTFWWHQYAAGTYSPGYLFVYVSTNEVDYSLYYQEQLEYSGINDWRQAFIDLSPLAGENTVSFMIRVITDDFRSDVALDDMIVNGSSSTAACTEISTLFTETFDGSDAWGDGSGWRNTTNYNTGNYSSAYITSEAGNSSTGGLLMEGFASNTEWNTNLPADGATAFLDNASHIQTVARTFCNPAASTITLTFDLKQTYSYNQDYSWFCLNIDSVPIAEQGGNTYFQPTTNVSDPFQTLTYDLSAYAGSTFSLEFKSCNKYQYSYYASGGDAAFIDNVKIVSACGFAAGTVSGTTSINCGETTDLVLSGQDLGATLNWQWKTEGSDTWVDCSNTTATIGNYGSAYLGQTTEYRVVETNLGEVCYGNNGLAYTVTTANCTNVNVWTGQTSTAWGTGSNWTQGTPPSGTQEIFIGNEYANTSTLSDAEPNVIATGLTVQSGATLTHSSTGLQNPQLTDYLTNNGTINLTGGGRIYIIGGGTTNAISNSGTMSSANIEVGSGTITAGSNLNIRTLVVSGGKLDMASNDLTISSTVQVTGGELDLGTGTMTISGDISVSSTGTINSATSTITLKGGVEQIINSNSSALNNLIVNNSAGIKLSDAMNIGGSLTLTTGNINTNGNILELTGSAADLIGGTSSSFIIATSATGALRRHIGTNTDTYVFPVGLGAASTDYYQMDLENDNLGGMTYLDVFMVRNDGTGSNHSQYGTAYEDGTRLLYFCDEEWSMNPDAEPTSGSFNLTLHLTNLNVGWGGTLQNDKFTIVKRPTASQNFGDYDSFDGSTIIPTAGEDGRTVTSGYAYKQGFTGFSKATVVGSNESLPIELLDFTAVVNEESTVALSWATATEINNNFFTVERSSDGTDFEAVMEVQGAGTSNHIIEYDATDINPRMGINYYRLKQTDFDGSFKYSEMKTVNIFKSNSFSVWPNPAAEMIEISFGESTDLLTTENNLSGIKIYNSIGKLVYKKSTDATSSKLRLDVSSYDEGMYFISLEKNGEVYRSNFLKD